MKKLLSIIFLFGILSISRIHAESSILEVEYLDVPNYPQENQEINPIVLSKFKIKNISSEIITINSIKFVNKGNVSLNKVSNIILISDGNPIELEANLENVYKSTQTFDLKAGETKNFEVKASVNGVNSGEFFKIEIKFNQDLLIKIKNEPTIIAPKKSQLRIIGDEMGDYNIMEGQKNLPLLAFHIQSDELTLIPTLKIILDDNSNVDIANLRKTFVNFKLFDNERQIFVHPTTNI
ncbi:hypothetical protein, partial [Candidatus Harpocratesius sp.]